MKFAISDNVDKVNASLEVDKDGDLVLRLNGVRTLFITSSGEFGRFFLRDKDIASLGIRTNSLGQILENENEA